MLNGDMLEGGGRNDCRKTTTVPFGNAAASVITKQ